MRNDTEILKALEICSSETRTLRCEDCPYHNDTDDISCSDQICKDAIELIKKQRAEIELLQKELILKNNALLNITYIAKRFPQTICDHCRPDFNRNNLPVNVWEAKEGYDDLFEFSEIVIRCNDTARKGKCSYCPFYDRCKIDEPENRHIQCGELERTTEKGGAE